MRQNDPLTMKIAGGLGNQLFMFYAGLFFSEKFKREVVFDISDLARIKKLHPGENIKSLGLLTNWQTITNASTRSIGRVSIRLGKFGIGIPKQNTFIAHEIGFVDPRLVPPDIDVIQGYFQSWRYFKYLKDKPLLGIDNARNPTDWLTQHLSSAKRLRILSLHLRRGDYMLRKNRENGILSTKYYESILSQVKGFDKIWIFTDSPKEVQREFLNNRFSVEVMSPPSNSDPVESLLLMSTTSQIVISNSTFSWWAAAIALPATSIIAPSKWFKLRNDPVDLIPDSWIRFNSDWAKR